MSSIIKVGKVQSSTGQDAIEIANSGAINGLKIADGGTIGSASDTDAISISSSGAVTLSSDFIPATPLSHRNMIINGAMQVWQRGTSSTTTSYQTVDRFRWDWSQGTITQSQLALTSGSPFDEGFRYAYRATCTSNTANTNAYVQCNQEIEAQNIANSGWNYKSASSYITLSFWARSSLAGTYYTQLRTVDGSEYIYYKAFTLSADTWTKVTCTIPGNSNLQFDNNNDKGLRVLIVAHYGTDYTGGGEASSETWYSRSSQGDAFLATNFAQNWSNTSSATFDVTGVQLELGSAATPFEHRSYGDELARCQRYYVTYPEDAHLANGYMYNGTYFTSGLNFPVAMRASPTKVEVKTGTNLARVYRHDGGSGYFNDITHIDAIYGASTLGVAMDDDGQVTATAGSGCRITIHSGASVSFKAEFT